MRTRKEYSSLQEDHVACKRSNNSKISMDFFTKITKLLYEIAATTL